MNIMEGAGAERDAKREVKIKDLWEGDKNSASGAKRRGVWQK